MLEDDDALREDILLPALTDYGFRTTGARSARELYRLMLDHRFDIVVLDIGLPDEDGISVAAHLRKNSSMGLVMLTASRERQDHIRALTESVDAFLNKPVDPEVLAATLHSLSRRLELRAPEIVRNTGDETSPDWRLESGGWRLVSPNEQIIALTSPERSVLVTLMEQPGQPTSRDELIERLTCNIYDFDPHRLDMLIHRLRRKVEKQTGEKPPLLTARGAGYVFAVDTSAS